MNTETKDTTSLTEAVSAMLDGAAQGLAQLADCPVSFDVSDSTATVDGGIGSDLVFAGAFTGSSRFSLSETAAKAIVAALAEDATEIDLDNESSISNLTDAFAQLAIGAAGPLTTAVGEPVALSSENIAANPPSSEAAEMVVVGLVATVGDQTGLTMSWEIDGHLAQDLAARWLVATTPAPAATAPPATAAAPAAPGPAPARSSSGVIDTVELDVAVELGNVALTIGELLHLGEGSVVTLTQSVGDDVVMLANGTPVASGEVVVVEGTLGFRVSALITDTRGA